VSRIARQICHLREAVLPVLAILHHKDVESHPLILRTVILLVITRDKTTMSHGVKRQRESPEKEQARKEKEKTLVHEYKSLVQDIMTRVPPKHLRLPDIQRNAHDYSQDAFNQTTALLKRNPEFYTVWNYRRQILLQGLFIEYPPPFYIEIL
jgi:Protein prenyltransferase alpha subunit repeat